MNEYIPKLSIGIPIYNVEKYIYQCAKSLFNQSYPNIEYVFVDDGSTDNSLEILYEVIAQYPEIDVKVIKSGKNCGLWNARNISIDNMTGELCAFCDSDDWLEPDAYNYLIQELIDKKADLVITSYIQNLDKREAIITAEVTTFASINVMPIDVLHFSMCNKVFRRDILNKYSLRTYMGLNCWEDLSITSRYMAIASKILFIDKPFYHYRKDTQQSLTGQSDKKRLVEQVKVAENITQWFLSRTDQFNETYKDFIMHMQFASKIKMLRGQNKRIEEWKCTFPESNKRIMSYTFIPYCYRILFWLVWVLPTRLTQLISNIFGSLCK